MRKIHWSNIEAMTKVQYVQRFPSSFQHFFFLYFFLCVDRKWCRLQQLETTTWEINKRHIQYGKWLDLIRCNNKNKQQASSFVISFGCLFNAWRMHFVLYNLHFTEIIHFFFFLLQAHHRQSLIAQMPMCQFYCSEISFYCSKNSYSNSYIFTLLQFICRCCFFCSFVVVVVLPSEFVICNVLVSINCVETFFNGLW